MSQFLVLLQRDFGFALEACQAEILLADQHKYAAPAGPVAFPVRALGELWHMVCFRLGWGDFLLESKGPGAPPYRIFNEVPNNLGAPSFITSHCSYLDKFHDAFRRRRVVIQTSQSPDLDFGIF
jgi:hypothetical protein